MKKLIIALAVLASGLAFCDLPDRFVKYVETTNKSTYVNTGLYQVPNTTRSVIDFEITQINGTTYMFGVWQNATSKNTTLHIANNSLYLTLGGNSSSSSVYSFPITINERYTIAMEDMKASVYGNNYFKELCSVGINGRDGSTATLPLFLFTRTMANGTPDANGTYMRLYGCRIYIDGTTLSANYIPCVKDDVAGLYDTVSGEIVYPERGTLLASDDDNTSWKIENGTIQARMEVSLEGDGGTTENAGTQWVAVGSEVELSATPDENMQSLWESDHAGASSAKNYGGNSLSFAMPPFPVKVNLSFSDSSYLPKVSNLADLVSAAEEDAVLELDEGTYYIDDTIVIDKNITLRGKGMDNTFIKPHPCSNIRAMKILSDCLVANLTVAGFTNHVDIASANHGGTCVYMENGTLDGVRVSGNKSFRNNLVNGCGVAMKGGKIQNSVVEDNFVESGYGGIQGIGIYASGGEISYTVIANNSRSRNEFYGGGIYIAGSGVKVTDCRIVGNGSHGKGNNSSNTRGMGIYMGANGMIDRCVIVSNDIHAVYMNNGTMKNCLIYGHETTSPSYTAGVEIAGGSATMYNCTISDNRAPNTFAGLKMTNGNAVNNIIFGNGQSGDVYVTGGTFNNNIVDNLGSITTSKASGNGTADPLFVNPAEGDFSIGFTSPALDAGVEIASVETDIYGTARPQGDGYDIGAYEWEPASGGDLIAAIIVPTSRIPDGDSITVTARTIGGTGEYSYTWYVDGELCDYSTSSPTFENLNPGFHSIKVVISDGESSVESFFENAFEVCPFKVYVATDGGNIYPYNEPEKAARDVNAAFSALWFANATTAEMEIAEGHYFLTATLNCVTPVKIIGAGMDQTIFDGSNLGYGDRAILIDSNNVIVKDLTIMKYKNNLGGTAVRMNKAGLVENVRLTENCGRNPSGGDSLEPGIAIRMSAGTVRNCVIDKNYGDSSYGNLDGLAVRMDGGEVTDCLITGNYRMRNQVRGVGVGITGGRLARCSIIGNYNNGVGYDATDTQGIGLLVFGANAVVENCTVVDNGLSGIYITNGKVYNTLVSGHNTPSTSKPAGVWQAGGELINCTIARNTAKTEANNDLVKDGGTMVNTIAEHASVTASTSDHHNLVNQDAGFKNPAKGNFRLRRSSAAYNTGDNSVWAGFDDPTDLDGNPRIGVLGGEARAVDIGCYELLPSMNTVIMLK